MEEEQSSIPEKQEPTDEQGTTQQAGGTTTAAAAAAVRSYECNFCKRGFTNAQALGGHMNIHRKDKAKLKQSSTMPSSDPLTPQPQHFPPSPNFLPPPNMFQTQPGKWTFSSSKDHIADIHIANKNITEHVKEQLPLLAADNQNPLPPPSWPADQEPPPPELDLELRLGHNTDQLSSDQQRGTRKFF